MPIRRALPVLLVLAAPACVRWAPVPAPVPAPDAPRRLGAARVTRADWSVVELHYVVVTADSVVGWRAAQPRVREALARAQVLRMERQRVDLARTGGVLLLLAAAALWVQLASAM